MEGQELEIKNLEDILNDATKEPIQISYAALKSITKNFAEVIGSGGFGVVYLGSLQDGMVAVKQLKSKDPSYKLFLDEVACLKRAQHKNIVRFLGYCAETQGVLREIDGKEHIVEELKTFLCFEYVPNGDIHRYIKEKVYGHEWSIRYKIIKGICEGLNYLHEKGFLHLDLKPANVLLAAHMEPKITDFGSSRGIDNEQTRVFTINVFVTPGYTAPESIDKGELSFQSDVFSLGRTMIRLLIGSNDDIPENWHESFAVGCPQMKRCVEIAQSCVDREPRNRPSIADIIRMLEETEESMVDENVPPPPVINEPRNDPESPLYQIVQRFRELFTQNKVVQRARMSLVLMEQHLLERIIAGNGKPSQPTVISYSLLQVITDYFSNERKIMDDDPFGVVYKGILGNKVIAVKKLLSNALVLPEKLAANELRSLMGVHHENIHKLVGFCHENQIRQVEHGGKVVTVETMEAFLCYEHVPKGSLDEYIFGRNRIEWDKRFKIIEGICKGLHFLHKEMDAPIIHMNLTPHNILLDDNIAPKITNFGISRRFGLLEPSLHTRNIIGFKGYMAPEYLYRGEFSPKSDIYSLGILILQICTGEGNVAKAEDMSGRGFIEEVQREWTECHIISAFQSLDAGGLRQVKACIGIGLRCVSVDRKERPSIVEILDMLNGGRPFVA